MKTFLYLTFFFSLSLAGCYSVRELPSSSDYYDGNYSDREVTYQTFYDELQPYGNWVSYPGHGYVWLPDAGSGFRPYETNGRWVSTVDGWAWASDYNWGWAPFHYGRWLNDPLLGWAWVPGYQWAPAWVTWGQYNNYYAWAPLAPGINIGFGNSWRPPYSYWSCVPNNYIHHSNLGRYVIRNNNTVVNNITIINNYNTYNNSEYYHRGPDYTEVEKYTRRPVRPVAITQADKPGSPKFDNNNRELRVYRPAIAASNTTSVNASPSRVRTIDEIKSRLESQRTAIKGINDDADKNKRPVRLYPSQENTGLPNGADRRSIENDNNGNSENNTRRNSGLENARRRIERNNNGGFGRERANQNNEQGQVRPQQVPQVNTGTNTERPTRRIQFPRNNSPENNSNRSEIRTPFPSNSRYPEPAQPKNNAPQIRQENMNRVRQSRSFPQRMESQSPAIERSVPVQTPQSNHSQLPASQRVVRPQRF